MKHDTHRSPNSLGEHLLMVHLMLESGDTLLAGEQMTGLKFINAATLRAFLVTWEPNTLSSCLPGLTVVRPPSGKIDALSVP